MFTVFQAGYSWAFEADTLEEAIDQANQFSLANGDNPVTIDDIAVDAGELIDGQLYWAAASMDELGITP